MRKRVGSGIGLALLVGTAIAAPPEAATGHRTVTNEQLTWGSPPPGLPAGAQLAVVDGDPTKPGFFVVRLRAPDGYVVRPHWHSQDERITVLTSRFEMSVGDEPGKNVTVGGPGAYFMMPGGHHHAARVRGDTIVQIDGLGPFDITYVNPMDDPRAKRSGR